MPRRVSELPAPGVERSAESGQTAESATRRWRVLLNSPQETYDVQSAVGVRIGDLYPSNSNLPCVSISETADGESRVVRVVTASYKTSAGDAGGGGSPQSSPPDVRPGKISFSSSIKEVAVRYWRKYNDETEEYDRGLAKNPAGDVIDGLTKMMPVETIKIEQFNRRANLFPGVGYVNNDDINFLGQGIPKFSALFKGYSSVPHVEWWGDYFFRGWLTTYEFELDDHELEIPLSGFNIINSPGVDVDPMYLALEHVDGRVDTENMTPVGGVAGKKVRAVIPIPYPDGGWCQRPSASPIALNRDGTPRSPTADPPVLTDYVITHRLLSFGDNFVNLGVRIREAL